MITSGGSVVRIMNVEGVMMLVVVGSSVQDVAVVVSGVYSAQAEVVAVAVVVIVISGYEGAGVDSGNDVNGLAGGVCGGGNEGISVTVTTTVAGDWVIITVDTNVDKSVCVTGGRVFDSTTVVAASTLVEPPSTGTTEYVASLRANGRLLRSFGVKGRASARIVSPKSARRLGGDESLMTCDTQQ